MGAFLFAAMSIVAVTILLLLRPWQRRDPGQPAGEREINAGIYRDQLAELDRDLAAGTLAAADRAQSRDELQRRVLEDAAPAQAAPAQAQAQQARHTTLLIAIVLPLAASGLYALLGAPEALQPQPVASAATHQATPDAIERTVSDLAARLAKDPADPKGWAMLGRSYRALGRFEQAQAAFAQIGEPLNKDPALLAEYADVMATLAGGNLEGAPLRLVMTALAIDPEQPMALSLAATAAYKRRDFPEAARHWQRLLRQLPPDSDDAQWLLRTLAEIGAKAAPAGPATAAGAGSISGSVSLSPRLRDRVLPSDTVFVFARPASGSRMPLAMQRARVADLPLEFTLDDSTAMSPQHKLSGAAEVRVEARVSRSGEATPAVGDLIAVGEIVKIGSRRVVLQIDRVRP